MATRREHAFAAEKLSEAQQQQVRLVLEGLLHSSAFGSAHRGQRFLRYIVEEALKGNREGLKERTIGVEVFERDPEYSTGEDAVVRVQAGDVRRRLERYFAHPEAASLPVEILLPIGTYCPEFVFRQAEEAESAAAPAEAQSEKAGTTVFDLKPETVVEEKSHPAWFGRKAFYVIAALAIAVVLLSIWWGARRHESSAFQQFWAPYTRVQQPVLICVAKPTPYYFSREFLIAHGATRTGEFNTEWQKMGRPFILSPDETLRGRDLQPMQDFGVAAGDVHSAVQLSLAFARMKKESQLRVGGGYQFEDLRSFPTVLIGAFNNRWSMMIGSGMPYRFLEDDKDIGIQEIGGAKRRWVVSSLESGRRQDFAIVARLMNTETGQAVIIVGGIGAAGTQAATEFITGSAELPSAIEKLPKDWANRNVEFVIGTKVTDGIAGPPSVVTYAVW